MNLKMFYRPALYIILGLYIVFSYHTLSVVGRNMDNFFFTEDHYFENVGAISLFATSAIFFYGFLRVRKQPLKSRIHWIKQLAFLGFALIAFFGAGEEISWGQRIFNFQTPQALNNAQGEFTVHNIEVNGGQINMETPFTVFLLTVFVLLPLGVMLFAPIRNLAEEFFPAVFLPIGGLFVINYISAKVAKILYAGVYGFSDVIPFSQAVQEVKESHYELLFVFVALYAVLRLASGEVGGGR